MPDKTDGDEMSRATFQIAYDGPAMAGHSMDVQQLGPALLSIGDLCREANSVINGPDALPVNVNVRANFEENCFDITLDIIQVYRDVSKFLKTEDMEDAKRILEWIGLLNVAGGGLTIVSLFAFLKLKKGRKIVNKTEVKNASGPNSYYIAVEGEKNSITVINQVYNLSASSRVRSAQRGIVAPLKQDGIDVVEIRENGETINRFTKEEFNDGVFDIVDGDLEEDELFEPQIFKAALVIRAPVFVEGKKWQFWLGKQIISAAIVDEHFNRRVFAGGERFGVGDRLHARVSLTQKLTATGAIGSEYEIVEVLKIEPGPTQTDFFEDNGES